MVAAGILTDEGGARSGCGRSAGTGTSRGDVHPLDDHLKHASGRDSQPVIGGGIHTPIERDRPDTGRNGGATESGIVQPSRHGHDAGGGGNTHL